MPYIDHPEFGRVTVRRTSGSGSLKISFSPNGSLRVSAPRLMPLFMVKRTLASSAKEIREMQDAHPNLRITDGMSIGKRHTVELRIGSSDTKVTKSGHRIIIHAPNNEALRGKMVTDKVRTMIISTLKKEAKEYLPKRIGVLAESYGFSYGRLRYSHASGRWGSCSSKGNISLNIALMNLPYELIDYVLVHELAHTRQLNHSKLFWNEVRRCDPSYELHRRALKSYSPHI